MQRAVGFDIIRIIAIGFVIISHFSKYFSPAPYGTYTGNVGITLFFLLSGYLLNISFSRNSNLKNYFTKRFLTIFPLLWITFIFFYILHSLEVGDFYYGGEPYKLIYSFLGIDGYLSVFGDHNYFVTGEWYTAAILFLYLIFPLLYEMMKKNVYASTALIYALYAFSYTRSYLPITGEGRPFIFIAIFWTGMLLQKFNEWYKPKYYWLIPLVSIVIVSYLNIGKLVIMPLLHLSTICLFESIVIATQNVHLSPTASKLLAFSSSIIFAIYLVQHVVMEKFLDLYSNGYSSSFEYFRLFFLDLLVTFVIATILYFISEGFVKLFGSIPKAIKKRKEKKAQA